MQEIEVNLDRCEVACQRCGARYSTTVHEDEIPLLCDICYTPSLRVTTRELLNMNHMGFSHGKVYIPGQRSGNPQGHT